MNTVLDILANKYRRRLLAALLKHNPQDDEDPPVPADVTVEGDDLKELRTAMTHSHLPKLKKTRVHRVHRVQIS